MESARPRRSDSAQPDGTAPMANATARRSVDTPSAADPVPGDFVHTGHVNDILWRYRMSSEDAVVLALSYLPPRGAVD